MQVAPKPRKKPAAPEAGLNPVQLAPIRNPPRQAPEAEPKLPPRVAEAGRNSAGGAIRSIREPLNPNAFNHHRPAPMGRQCFPGAGTRYDPRSSVTGPLLFSMKQIVASLNRVGATLVAQTWRLKLPYPIFLSLRGCTARDAQPRVTRDCATFFKDRENRGRGSPLCWGCEWRSRCRRHPCRQNEEHGFIFIRMDPQTVLK